MSIQTIRRKAAFRWRARRLGLFLAGAGLMVLAAVVLPWLVILMFELLGWTPERGRIFIHPS